jgi:hypothetical protein
MIEVYGTTFARVDEIKRGMLVRLLAGFHVVSMRIALRITAFVSGSTMVRRSRLDRRDSLKWRGEAPEMERYVIRAKTVLHDFRGSHDALGPNAVTVSDGILYGVTANGGSGQSRSLFK